MGPKKYTLIKMSFSVFAKKELEKGNELKRMERVKAKIYYFHQFHISELVVFLIIGASVYILYMYMSYAVLKSIYNVL